MDRLAQNPDRKEVTICLASSSRLMSCHFPTADAALADQAKHKGNLGRLRPSPHLMKLLGMRCTAGEL
jgi:hypothetical protein